MSTFSLMQRDLLTLCSWHASIKRMSSRSVLHCFASTSMFLKFVHQTEHCRTFSFSLFNSFGINNKCDLPLRHLQLSPSHGKHQRFSKMGSAHSCDHESNSVISGPSVTQKFSNSHSHLSPLLLKHHDLSVTQRRQYHSHHLKSKFTLDNPLYKSYLKSLVNEFKAVNSTTSNQQNERRGKEDQLLHVAKHQFLKTANTAIEELFSQEEEIEELAMMLESEDDECVRKQLEKEIMSCKNNQKDLEDDLVDTLVGEEPADKSNVIVDINAGVGGQEAMLFCAEVFNMYCQYARSQGWTVAITGKGEMELGGYRKASMEVSGMDVYKHLKNEAGVHRVQRVPKTEKAGRVHTSTISVSVMPKPRELDIQIEKNDLKIETFRGSGPGGQSVNTTDSAVRITHLPTGIVSECKQERSQIKNKDIALKNLEMRIYQSFLDEQEVKRKATRKIQIGTKGRSEKIRTYNFQQDRVTDHRLKENVSNLPVFLAGGENFHLLIISIMQFQKCETLNDMLNEFEFSLKKKS